VTNTVLLNHNNALSEDSRQRTKELQDKSALLIAKSQELRLHAGELINQSQRMGVGALRMQIFRDGDTEALSEHYCWEFEMSEAAARYKSNLIDDYPGFE
jgi:hypothetical protein